MNRIRDLRAQRGWTQDDLAARLNLKRQAVGHYETGQRDIDSATIHRLCDIFGCSADYLLGRSPLPSPELTPEEEELLLSWRRATPWARGSRTAPAASPSPWTCCPRRTSCAILTSPG